ncbi:MAG: LysM peptidoglycan-binding domain-containing M23 family metallopeptidase [Huintestinicola sp.]
MMNGKRDILKELFGLIEWFGSNTCNVILTVASLLGSSGRRLKKAMSKAASPLKNDLVSFLLGMIRRPLARIVHTAEENEENAKRFAHRRKMFGFKKAAYMQYREMRLAAKRKGSPAAAIFNVIFPLISLAALVLVIRSNMATNYVVSVEYNGEEMGIIAGDNVLSDAQKLVANRIEYYDIGKDYFVNASVSVKPLSFNDKVLDEAALAGRMEAQIAGRYDEIDLDAVAAQEAAEEEAELHGNKIKAYGVRVDGQFLGAVRSYEAIEQALDRLKEGYDDPSYVAVFFDKDVEYDIEEYVDPSDIVGQQEIIKILTGYESAPEYYEVQEGDYLLKIADAKGMTLEEISSCYATYNGKVIEDLEHSILRVGTLIQFKSEVPYLQVEYQKQADYRKTLEYETIYIQDPALKKGQEIVEVEGQNGEKRGKALVTYRDGSIIRKSIIPDTSVVDQPVARIVRIGTGGQPVNYNAPQFSSDKGSGEYTWPVDGGYISAYQGDGRGHKGIDIAAPYGTAIYAAASGTVTKSATGWNGGYGNVIEIQNDDGNLTVYAHQAELAAQLGDYVKQGQLIGYVGSTGDSTGNHLHFEVRKDGRYIDPITYVGEGSQKPSQQAVNLRGNDMPAVTSVTTVTTAATTTAKPPETTTTAPATSETMPRTTTEEAAAVTEVPVAEEEDTTETTSPAPDTEEESTGTSDTGEADESSSDSGTDPSESEPAETTAPSEEETGEETTTISRPSGNVRI